MGDIGRYGPQKLVNEAKTKQQETASCVVHLLYPISHLGEPGILFQCFASYSGYTELDGFHVGDEQPTGQYSGTGNVTDESDDGEN